MKKFIIALFVFLTPTFANAWTLPSDRGVTWTGNVGAFTDWSVTRTDADICTTLSPTGGANDADDIQAALNACPTGGVVKLNAGTFLLTTTITWPKNSVTLRGSGMDITILQVQSGLNGDSVFVVTVDDSTATQWMTNTNRSVSSGYTKGSTQISTSTAHGWSSGDYILIDQSNDTTGPPIFDVTGYDGTCTWCSRDKGSGANRLFGQVVKITSVDNSTTISFTPPLYQTYNPSNDITAVNAPSTFRRDISIENLTVNNTNHYAAKIIESWGMINSVISGVEFDGLGTQSNSGFFMFHNAYFTTIKNSVWHHTGSSDSSANYGLWFMYSTSANLVVNNVIYDVYNGIINEGGFSSGHVIAYNYFTSLNPQSSEYVAYAIPFHYNGSFMSLFEGNHIDGGSIRIDSASGSSAISNTFFRNRVELDTARTDALHDINAEHGNYYLNLVGNVIGTSGFETKYECYNTGSNCATTTKVIYRLGYDYPFDETAPYDTLVKTSMLRHYNWDSVTNGTKICTDSGETGCQGGTSDTTLPDSLYYTSKPSWWCSESTWPPVNPAGATAALRYSKIPAQIRYEGGTCTTGTTPPSATPCTMSGAVFQ